MPDTDTTLFTTPADSSSLERLLWWACFKAFKGAAADAKHKSLQICLFGPVFVSFFWATFGFRGFQKAESSFFACHLTPALYHARRNPQSKQAPVANLCTSRSLYTPDKCTGAARGLHWMSVNLLSVDPAPSLKMSWAEVKFNRASGDVHNVIIYIMAVSDRMAGRDLIFKRGFKGENSEYLTTLFTGCSMECTLARIILWNVDSEH